MSNDRPCAGKKAWPTKKQADDALAQIRNNPNRTIQVPRYSFLCPHGCGYHLSSNPPKKDVAMICDILGLKPTATVDKSPYRVHTDHLRLEGNPHGA